MSYDPQEEEDTELGGRVTLLYTLLVSLIVIIIVWAVLRCLVLSEALRQLLQRRSCPQRVLERALGPIAMASIAPT